MATRPRLPHRPELDGIRGLAVLLVVFSHAEVPGFRWGGQVGVTLFFVLSGYLITGLLIAERQRTGTVNLRAFYGRRARRLLPALALLVVVALVVGWITVADVAPIALYVGNWTRAAGDDLGHLGHTWSLAIEEQFYLLWPVAFLAGVRSPRVLVALAGVAAATRLLTSGDFQQFATLTRADGLLAGSALAIVGPRRVDWRPGLLLVLAVACISWPRSELFVIGLGVAVAGSTWMLAGARPGALSAPPLMWVGRISYALYLWHVPLVFATGWPAWVAVPISIGAAWVSTRYLEEPIRAWRVRRSGSMRKQVGPAVVD